MYKITLDTDTNTIVLQSADGEERYRPSSGTALELYQALRDAARDDPGTVVKDLQAAAQLVEPARPSVSVPNTPALADPDVPAPTAESWMTALSRLEAYVQGGSYPPTIPAHDPLPPGRVCSDPYCPVCTTPLADGVLGAAGGDNPYDSQEYWGNINNLSTEDASIPDDGGPAPMMGDTPDGQDSTDGGNEDSLDLAEHVKALYPTY